MFVYHLEFYLETYDGVEKIATYPIEGCHQENKRNFHRSTNKMGEKTVTEDNSAAIQLLLSLSSVQIQLSSEELAETI